jgi:serine/threonine protein phosphatase 1
MSKFVIGDIHGRFKALMEVIEKSNFNPKNDELYILGDVCDGGMQTFQVIDYLKDLPNKILITGNHDLWFIDYILDEDRYEFPLWWNQGGMNTMLSYRYKNDNVIPDSHLDFLLSGLPYHIENIAGKKSIFVHGGFDPFKSIEEQLLEDITWNRELCNLSRVVAISNYDQIFVGHTTTEFYGSFKPIQHNNLWMLDTGAGWKGYLTIMNIETKEYWQSEKQIPQT